MAGVTDELVFFVNGNKVSLKDVEPQTTLTAYLRRGLGLKGTKNGCDEGSCGVCTVMVSAYDKEQNRIRHKAVTSCMLPICTLHGLAVTTIEGIGSLRTGLHPVQERIVKFHGTQCGFCTPGMVMTMYTLLRNKPKPTQQEITQNLHGNICRCTGYRSIRDAFGTFAKDSPCSVEGSNCCQDSFSGSCCQDKPIEVCCQGSSGGTCCQSNSVSLTDVDSLRPFDPTQEPIFPPELQVGGLDEKLTCFRGRYVTWYHPVSLDQALQIKGDNPAARIASGCTSLAQELKRCHQGMVVIDVSGVKELQGHEIKDGVLSLGAGLSMADLIELKTQEDCKKVSILQAIPKALGSWGSQLKNSATVGGQIMLKSGRYDLIPLWVAGGCHLVVASKGERRQLPLDESFFLGPSPIHPDEILISLEVPCTQKFVETYKVAGRKHQDFASLSAAFVLDVSASDKLKIMEARIVFGGKIPSLVIPRETQKFLTGRRVTESVIGEAIQVLRTELLPPDQSGLSSTQSLWAQGFLSKCLLDLTTGNDHFEDKASLSPGDEHKVTARQIFEVDKTGTFSTLSVTGQPLTHATGEEQATGEAVFIDDMPPSANELFVYPVLSTRAHAKITRVDLTAALSIQGVHGYVDHKDIPGVNCVDTFYGDEELLATEKVHHCGQLIGGIVAMDRETAVRAAQCVQVTYLDQTPAIFTIQEAIEAKSFLGEPRVTKRGDLEAGFARSDQVLEGQVSTKGQKHIYLETISALVVPKERKDLEVFASMQMPSSLQMSMAELMGVAGHNIVVRTKRIGGAFGGKEYRTYLVAMLAALAANKFRHPVRCILERKDDTLINGGRHPSLAQYKVGFTQEGRIQALDVKVYIDGGATLELTQLALEMVVVRADGCYNIPALRMQGRACRTNKPTNGAVRGFGCPQSYWVVENIMAAVATHLSIPGEKIREMQLYKEGDTTLGDTLLENFRLRQCWEECKVMAEFDKRSQLVNDFNRANVVRKRGIAIQPVMFGIGIIVKCMNQGGALVHVYTDGSVLVSHGGCEMGQGLHTKIRQIACETLGVSIDKVIVSETATNTVPNTTVSAGSVSTDLNGGAVHAACMTLVERLRPFREANPTAGWDKWVQDAYLERVSLSATGFNKFGNCGFNFETGKGPDTVYYTTGAGCSEVEVDCLSGEHKVIRTDIVMDVGRSLNPAIDIGQIEGGFLQGYGYYMMEDVVYSPEGKLITDSPLSYKVPLAADVPAQFNVALLKNSANDKGIYSSRGVGEPPLMLSLSAYLAAREAVKAARVERGLSEVFMLEHPATPANVLNACTDGQAGCPRPGMD